MNSRPRSCPSLWAHTPNTSKTSKPTVRWTIRLLVLAACLPVGFGQNAPSNRSKNDPFATQILPDADRYIEKLPEAKASPTEDSARSQPSGLSQRKLRAKELRKLAESLEEKKDPKALEIYEQAAQAGDHYSSYVLAREILNTDRNKPRDIKKALSHYKRAAEGFAAACSDLGEIYLGQSHVGLTEEEKASIETDPKKAFQYFQQGADMTEEGNCPATLNQLRLKVGLMYANGIGTPQNEGMAFRYLQKVLWLPKEPLEDVRTICRIYLRAAEKEEDMDKQEAYREKAYNLAMEAGLQPTDVIEN